MSLLKQIETLRSRPEAERKKAALRLSITFTAVIVILWLGLVFVKTAQKDLVSKSNSATSTTPGISQMVSSFYDSVSRIFKSGSAELEKLKPAQEEVNGAPAASSEADLNNGQESTYFDQSGVESNQ
jgi:uncharacterized membrane protein